jgi:hypothetical protein
MRHRHLIDSAGLTPAAIDDILEHGSPQDWYELRREVDADPFGRVADDIARVCRGHAIYGASSLWLRYVEQVRKAASRPPRA